MSINVVVDISHHNGNVDLTKAQQAGLVGVIHKATQGTGMFDNMYNQNRQKAQAAGLLWGAYHFGSAGDGAAQADFFLSKANADDQTLLVLDYEPNGNSTMTLDQARAFVQRVKDVRGKVPVSIQDRSLSNSWAASRRTHYCPSAGSGLRNTVPSRQTFRRPGPPGPCGNTRMGWLGLSPMPSMASAIAIAISSTEP